MSVGDSGRIVLEIDPEMKKQLYQTLKSEGLNMKEWFLLQAEQLLTNSQVAINSNLAKNEGNANQ